MSNNNSTVSLTLQIKGQQAGQEMKKFSDQQIAATKQINQQWTQIGNAQATSVSNSKKIADELTKQGQALGGQKKEVTAIDLARKLGIRTEQQIKNEIKQTQSTYAQLGILQRQGLATTKDMERAYASMNSKVAQLNRELGKTVATEKQIQQIQKSNGGGYSVLQRGSAAAMGAVAGGAIFSNALQKPRDYDQQLTYIAATATGGQNMAVADRLAARSQLNDYIKSAVRAGGGTREDAAAAANTLIASGKYELSNVAPALNAAVKTAFSTDAAVTDAAALTVRMQDFGVNNLQRGHDIAVRGGQLGSFEYKDQAKWLAQQMAAARASGYSGEKGLMELVAMNQVAMSTAGTADEAGNNLVNLLTKLSSREFSKAIGDSVVPVAGDPTKSDGKKKPKQVFDWSTYSIQQRNQGVYGVEAFVQLLDRQLAGDKQYQRLQAMAKKGTSAERKAAIEDMSSIAMGSQLGEIIADRQALMAALSVVYKKDQLNSIRQGLTTAGGTVDADSAMVRQTEWAKDMAMEQEKLFAQSKAYDAVSDSLSTAKDKIVEWSQGNEQLAATTYGATVAIAGLGAAAGIAALAVGGKGVLGGAVGGAGTVAGGAAAGGVAKTAGVAAAGYLGYELFKPLDDFFYGKIAGLFGASEDRPDFMQMAIEKSQEQKAVLEQQNQLIEKQTQMSGDVVNKLNTLISVTQQNKPMMMGGGLMDQITQHAQAEQKRHGLDLLSYGQK
ncbi:phage tail tape measure protein [Acinetobacter dispersus]|uniref:phage tail tape measure protein n=1 Tax=Acinetobacter dispersus TaxID=70348 RepID=UPI00132EB250|nr:phage tail tape measure protein [Acinetobacter dispersus]QHH96686.1 phage tail tape measure protein [Acinetobacter dispersus]